MELDSLGVGQALELFPEQIKSAWTEAYGADLPPIRPVNIVISGMGGSSNAAKILEGIYEKDFKVASDIDIWNDYGLPDWVNRDTLVIVNSYSGNTEETLSAIPEVRRVGAKILGVTTGGKLAEMIKSGEIKGAIVNGLLKNPTNFPKTGLGVSFGALAAVLAKIGVLKLTQEELFAAVDNLIEIKKSWDAKDIAVWFHGSFPVLFGGRPFIGSLNAARNAMCEISRNFTQFYDFPEVNHVLIEATQMPEVAREKIKYFLFVSKFNHPRVLTRYKVTTQIFKEQKLEFRHYVLKGSTPLAQALEIPYFCTWIAYNLALLDGQDPGPEPWITRLKESLAQPVH